MQNRDLEKRLTKLESLVLNKEDLSKPGSSQFKIKEKTKKDFPEDISDTNEPGSLEITKNNTANS